MCLRSRDRIPVCVSPSRSQTVGPGYGERRDSRTEIDKWHGQISSRELAEVRALLGEFDLPFYKDVDLEAPVLVSSKD